MFYNFLEIDLLVSTSFIIFECGYVLHNYVKYVILECWPADQSRAFNFTQSKMHFIFIFSLFRLQLRTEILKNCKNQIFILIDFRIILFHQSTFERNFSKNKMLGFSCQLNFRTLCQLASFTQKKFNERHTRCVFFDAFPRFFTVKAQYIY